MCNSHFNFQFHFKLNAFFVLTFHVVSVHIWKKHYRVISRHCRHRICVFVMEIYYYLYYCICLDSYYYGIWTMKNEICKNGVRKSVFLTWHLKFELKWRKQFKKKEEEEEEKKGEILLFVVMNIYLHLSSFKAFCNCNKNYSTFLICMFFAKFDSKRPKAPMRKFFQSWANVGCVTNRTKNNI